VFIESLSVTVGAAVLAERYRESVVAERARHVRRRIKERLAAAVLAHELAPHQEVVPEVREELLTSGRVGVL
jgi:hypothetical protein